MLKLAKNRVISIAYIIEQLEEIVGVYDTIWNATEHQASLIQTLPTDNQPNKHGVITPEISTPICKCSSTPAPPTYNKNGTHIERTYKRKSTNPHQAGDTMYLPTSSNVRNLPLDKTSDIHLITPRRIYSFSGKSTCVQLIIFLFYP